MIERVCKASVHVVFNSKPPGLEEPGELTDLGSVPKPTVCYQYKGHTVEECRTWQTACLENIEVHVKKAIKMSEELKTQIV